MEIRKIVTVIEEIYADGEKKMDKPIRKVAVLAVIKNPYAGKYQEDLNDLIDFSEELGKTISDKAVEALGKDAEVHSYGKAAIVGEKGELELAAALLLQSWAHRCVQLQVAGRQSYPLSRRLVAWVTAWIFLFIIKTRHSSAPTLMG